MPFVLGRLEAIAPGANKILDSQSQYGEVVTFEDDGATAYFYARDHVTGEILDTLHVYDAATTVSRGRLSELQIGWSSSGRQAVLLIDGLVCAVFDFALCLGWSRRGVPATPPANGKWSPDGHQWDPGCLDYFW